MADLDMRAAWVCGLWAGVPQKILRERTKPLEKPDVVRRLVRDALASAPYLADAAQETLALLDELQKKGGV